MNPPCEERIIREVDPGDHVRHAESDLLGFGKKVVRISVQDHPPYRNKWHELFRDDLGRVEYVERERLGVFFVNLKSQLPFGLVARLDRFPDRGGESQSRPPKS